MRILPKNISIDNTGRLRQYGIIYNSMVLAGNNFPHRRTISIGVNRWFIEIHLSPNPDFGNE